jgi:hypothetical protein
VIGGNFLFGAIKKFSPLLKPEDVFQCSQEHATEPVMLVYSSYLKAVYKKRELNIIYVVGVQLCVVCETDSYYNLLKLGGFYTYRQV